MNSDHLTNEELEELAYEEAVQQELKTQRAQSRYYYGDDDGRAE